MKYANICIKKENEMSYNTYKLLLEYTNSHRYTVQRQLLYNDSKLPTMLPLNKKILFVMLLRELNYSKSKM